MRRKISAENIFTGSHFTGPGHVLVLDHEGTIKGVVPAGEGGEDVEIFSGILCPGFVNAHCHIELSHLKNEIPQHTGLVDFVQQVISKRFNFSAADKQAAMEAAVSELFESGTVAVGDICNTADSLPLKQASVVYWHNFIEVSGFVGAGAQKRFADAMSLEEDFTRSGAPAVISPHAPYSVSKKLFRLIAEESAGKIMSIHSSESPAENDLYRSGSGDFLRLYRSLGIDISSFEATGKTSFQSWLPYFSPSQRIISVHNSFLETADLEYLTAGDQGATITFCLCPNANRFVENVLPPVAMLVKNNCNMVLGTDSYASNTQLNMYAEIKTLQQAFPDLLLEDLLQWATLNGARALGIEDRFGSFENGKKPGVVQISGGTAKRIAL